MKAPFMAASLLSLAAVVGCNPATDSGPAATGDGNAAAVVPEGATLVSFDVPDMHWPISCGPAVRGALEEVDGVYDDNIEIDIPNRVASAYTDPDTFDVDTALAKLEEINFPATVKE